MNEFLYCDLKERPALTRSLATQIVQELGRRIVAGAAMAEFSQPGPFANRSGAEWGPHSSGKPKVRNFGSAQTRRTFALGLDLSGAVSRQGANFTRGGGA